MVCSVGRYYPVSWDDDCQESFHRLRGLLGGRVPRALPRKAAFVWLAPHLSAAHDLSKTAYSVYPIWQCPPPRTVA